MTGVSSAHMLMKASQPNSSTFLKANQQQHDDDHVLESQKVSYSLTLVITLLQLKASQPVPQHYFFWKPTNPWIYFPNLVSLLTFLDWFRSLALLWYGGMMVKGRQYQFLLLFHSKKLFFFFLILFNLHWPCDLLWFERIWQKFWANPLGSLAVSTFLLEANHHAESLTSLKLPSFEEAQAMRRKPCIIPDMGAKCL